jgi:hypothetical protein
MVSTAVIFLFQHTADGIVPMRICTQWNASSGRDQSASLTRIAESAGARVVVQKEPGYGRAQTSVKEAIAD